MESWNMKINENYSLVYSLRTVAFAKVETLGRSENHLDLEITFFVFHVGSLGSWNLTKTEENSILYLE